MDSERAASTIAPLNGPDWLADTSAAATPASVRSLPATIGRYRILRLLGEGGMGAVHEAEQEHPRRIVALKVMRSGLASSELLRRFEQESRVLGRLQHPGIAQIYEAGTADTGFGPQHYFAMEFIRGSSLRQYAEERHLNIRKRLDLVIKICDAVHHAHQRGVIHRDLKPGNILVDEAGQPKILDFGVARATDSDAHATRQTDLGQLVGTLAYMSPEQVLGDPLELDTRSDVYALGVILYELLAGRLPYQISQKLHEAVQTIREEDPAPLSSVSRVYRGDVETIVAKALEKDKARRYASAADLATDLRRYLQDEPIVARPASTTYQLQKFARRHKTLVAGMAAVFVVLVGGIAASTWQAARATRAQQAALLERDRAAAAEQRATKDRDRALSAETAATAAQAQALQDRNRAVSEKQRADTEAARAKAVNDFLQNDLLAQASAYRQARPDTKPDPDLKVRTALDRAAARIAGKFQAQPLMEASIRQTIGRAYIDLGLFPEAEKQLERALALRRRELGEQHGDTLQSMNALAELYGYEGKYGEVEPLFVRIMQVQRRVLGGEHPDTLTTMRNLGVSKRMQGKYAEAEVHFARVLKLDRHALGDQHPLTLASMNELATLYRLQGRYVQAEALYSKLLELQRRMLGEEHPDTLTGVNNLAILYGNQGKYWQAEPLLIEVLEGRRRMLGQEHPDTLASMSNLGVLFRAEGKYAQAEPLLTKAVEGRRRLLGDEHPQTLLSMSHLADLCRNQGRYTEAAALYTKVLESRRRMFGPDHPDTTNVLASLGQVRLQERKYAEAESLLREALSGQQNKSPSRWERYRSESMLGASLAGQRKYSEAEPLLLSGYQGIIEREAAIPWESRLVVDQAAERIIQLYQDWEKPEKAAEWREKLRTSLTTARQP